MSTQRERRRRRAHKRAKHDERMRLGQERTAARARTAAFVAGGLAKPEDLVDHTKRKPRVQRIGKRARSQHKPTDAILASVHRLGYRVEHRGSGHIGILTPDGHLIVTAASTTRNLRTAKNLTAMLRKAGVPL